ncbi:MAG: acylphosphatase [Planctomycetes bacterium]|nr:acylphosphatase [Planctomycetota bacterium]
MGLEARHIVVRGRVQGVAFRHHTKLVARALGLAGWVRNAADGSVEVWAEGEPQALVELVSFLREGPPLARVDSVAARVVDPVGEAGRFRVEGLRS